MSHPPVNALSRAIREELLHMFDDLSDREDIRVIVLTGNTRAFSAGADIKGAPAWSPAPVTIAASTGWCARSSTPSWTARSRSSPP